MCQWQRGMFQSDSKGLERGIMEEKTERDELHYWLWVTGPRYWLDEQGNDSPYLDPERKHYKREIWSCHKETGKGDLIFLWRSRRELAKYLRSIGVTKKIAPKSDIGYLIRAETKAAGPRSEERWPYWCRYKPVWKFRNPVTIEDFKMDPVLRNSLPFSAKFRRHCFGLSKEEWGKIIEITLKRNPDFEAFWDNFIVSKSMPLPVEKFSIPGGERSKTENETKRTEQAIRKYGPGGEGEDHKRLKKWIAENPNSIGLYDIKGPPQTEYAFISGDTADILFEREDKKFAVVEIETDNGTPGFYQALKYKVLKCAEAQLPINSGNVRAILVAWSVPDVLQKLCTQYQIEFREIKK